MDREGAEGWENRVYPAGAPCPHPNSGPQSWHSRYPALLPKAKASLFPALHGAPPPSPL